VTRCVSIVLELLANTLKFTAKGYAFVSVKLAKKQVFNIVVQIIIEDTGIGIPKDKQKELFVRFKCLMPSCQGIYKGM